MARAPLYIDQNGARTARGQRPISARLEFTSSRRLLLGLICLFTLSFNLSPPPGLTRWSGVGTGGA